MNARIAFLAGAAAIAVAVVVVQQTRDTSPLARCPGPNGEVAARPGPARVLLSPGADEVLVCRYDRQGAGASAAVSLDVVPGIPPGPREERPIGNRVAETLAELGPVDTSAMRGLRCRGEDPVGYAVVARYDHHLEVATIAKTGCGTATNGTMTTSLVGVSVASVLEEALALGG